MKRQDLTELHYIVAIENVPSILEHGILSNIQASRLPHQSVAMQAMQDRRAKKTVPGGRKLHSYANLYICGRNPMLYLRQAKEVCVLAVSPDVLDLDRVVVADGNAGGDYCRFADGASGLRIVDEERTFAEYWTDSDQLEYWRKKTAKCAEVLVPDRVDPHYLLHAYVRNEAMKAKLEDLGVDLPIRIDRNLFFG